MKKLLTVLFALCLVLSLAGCSNDDSSTEQDQGGDNQQTAEEATYTLGMGTQVSFDQMDPEGTVAQVDAAVAAVVLDADGKIVACEIDAIQNKMDIADGVVTVGGTYQTKMEKGDNYNMVAYSEATLEWYQQARNFADYCVGKTGAEVSAIETKVRDDGKHDGYIVAADEELFASCSIQITDMIEAVTKACNDEQATTFTTADEFKLGLAIESEDENSTDPTEDADGLVAMYSDYACSVINNDGVILADLTDAIQPKITFDADGTLLETTFNGTKRELKDGYNMVAYSEATLEWYQQAKNFADYCVGKTAEEVKAIETKVRDDGKHDGYIVAADEDLFASCSIQITAMKSVISRAAELAAAPLNK